MNDNTRKDKIINDVLKRGFAKQGIEEGIEYRKNENKALSPLGGVAGDVVGQVGEGVATSADKHAYNVSRDEQMNHLILKFSNGAVLSKEEALKGPPGQGMTKSYIEAGKEMVKLLDLQFVEDKPDNSPQALRDKFHSSTENKNTPQ